jgi:hypothetical protein
MIWANYGAETQFVVDRIADFKLEYPYNQCIKDPTTFDLNKTLINYILNVRKETYSQVNCLELCFDLDYIQNNACQCETAQIGEVWENCFETKESQNYTGCTFLYKMNFYKQNLLEKFYMYCPLECDSVSFKVMSNSLMNVSSKQFSTIVVYYRNLEFTQVNRT